MQSRAMSLVESVANIIVGFAIAVLAQMIVFPLFWIGASFAQNLGAGIVFTAVSLARSLRSASHVRWAFPATDRAQYSRPWQAVDRRPIRCPTCSQERAMKERLRALRRRYPERCFRPICRQLSHVCRKAT